eukprot:GGOE01045126.1.p1 GENE.GGOE01045126.1~~GGOE01045126.1.p1  ORF type:complete len:657 (+),score=181.43 GGOE01045126.1:252-1973(+)
MAPVLHVELSTEGKELLASLNWSKAEMKTTVVELVSGLFFQAGIPDSISRNFLMDPMLVNVLTKGLVQESSLQAAVLLKWQAVDGNGERSLELVCQPWSFEECEGGTWRPIPGAAVGTCYRDKGLPQSAQLFNTYTQRHVMERVTVQHVVRHSVVDTRERADMLVALLKQLDFGPKRRVRLLNLLTRRQGEEEALWQQQLAQMHYLRERLAMAGVQLLHLSFQANANCNFNFWNQGEDANTTSNATAWLKYCEWLLHDLRHFAEEQHFPDSLKLLISDALHTVLSSLRTPLKTSLSSQRGSWVNIFGRVSLDEQGPAHYKQLGDLANDVLPLIEEAIQQYIQHRPEPLPDTSLLLAIPVLVRLIRSQYPAAGDQMRHSESKQLGRVSEFLSLALLDRLLGIVSCMNCKSGCDRCGLVHALTTAANIVFDNHSARGDWEVFARTCVEFDTLAETVDEHTQTFEKFVVALTQWQHQYDDNDRALLLVSEIRNWAFVALMNIGWRVNIRSTGLAGLKFHLGSVSANPHVAGALPPYIIGKYSAAEEGFQAISVHRKLSLNRKVADFLNGASQFRGA